jgi:hypothetical protein
MIERARVYAKRREVRWKEMEAVKAEMAEKQRELALKELTGETKSDQGNVNSVIRDKVNGVEASPTPTKSKKKKNKK